MVRLTLLVALGCALITTSAAASLSPGVGTATSGLSKAASCRHGDALVGFVGTPALLFGNVIVGRVRPLCAPPPGLFSSPQRIGRVSIGTLGTYKRRHRCPNGTVATGILGRSGDLVDRIRLMCQALDFEQQRTGPVSYTGETGGLGGKPDVDRCPRSEYATGFVGSIRRGDDDDVIEALRLRCVI